MARDASRLSSLDYPFEALKALMLDADLTTLQLVWREAPDRFRARDPFPVGGVVEDPATGAAAAALGAYLRERGEIVAPATFEISQGVEMGRPSRITVSIAPGEDGRPRVGHGRPDLTAPGPRPATAGAAGQLGAAGGSGARASRSAAISARRPASSASIVEVGIECRRHRRQGRRRRGLRFVAEVDRRNEDAGEDAGQRADDPDAGEHDHDTGHATERGDRILVAVADGRDRHDRPPQRVAAGRDVGVRRGHFELEHEDARRDEHDERRQDRDEGGVLASVLEDVQRQGPCRPGRAAAG